jgi:ABC-type multidrug transport system fused ATPase/permease subunit
LLKRDIKNFDNGIHTILGDRGKSLSGGQKAKISLARALYYDPDIYLFDAPLVSIDINDAN